MPALPPTPVATLQTDTIVTAAGGWTAWSEQGADRRWSLVVRRPDGTLDRPPVGTRSVMFDVDLGRDSGGTVVAAYSRCATEPPGTDIGTPSWRFGKGCRIAILDLAQGRERLLPLARGTRSDVLPSVAGGRVAYVAEPGPLVRLRRGRSVLRRRSLGVTHVRDLATGRDTALRPGPSAFRPERDPGTFETPLGVDFDGTTIAATWALDTTDSTGTIYYTRKLTRERVPGRPRTVATQTSGGSEELDCTGGLVGSSLLSGGIVWLRQSAQGWVGVLSAPGGGRRYGPAVRPATGRRFAVSAAADGDRLVVAERDGGPAREPGDVTTINSYPLGAWSASTPKQAACVE